jgi:hypothetical protein
MKVLTHLNPIDQSVPTPLFCVLPMKDKSKFVFGPSCWKGVWFHILPLHCHGRRVCGKSKAKVGNGECVWTLWVSEWVREYLVPRSCPKNTPYKDSITHTHTLVFTCYKYYKTNEYKLLISKAYQFLCREGGQNSRTGFLGFRV